MTPPLFSIVIPTYNRSELVQGAVRSVLGQTFDDFEVVVSDNCSQDDTRAVIERFEDPRVRYVRTPTHGVIAESWEFARSQARGTLVMMLSDDDALVHERAGAFRRRAPAPRRRVSVLQSGRIPRPVLSRTAAEHGELPAVLRRRARWCPPTNFCGRCSPSGRSSTCIRARSCSPAAWPIRWCSVAGGSSRPTASSISPGRWRPCSPAASSTSTLPLVILGRTAKSWGSTVVLSNPGKQQIQKMIADVGPESRLGPADQLHAVQPDGGGNAARQADVSGRAPTVSVR